MEPIPFTEDPKRYESRAFGSSGFVELRSDARLDIQMQYPLLGMKHATEQCFVREEVNDRLVKAASSLPAGYKLRIWDAWRPFALQHELYHVYADRIIEEFELQQCSEEQKKAVIRRFVSDPVEDRDVPPVHTTGGAVDVTILDDKGSELEMGTAFDAFSDRTCTAFFENEKQKQIRANRRLLYSVMTNAGFVNLPSEWWHYDYGDRFWAYYNKKPAIYRGVFTEEELYGGGV